MKCRKHPRYKAIRQPRIPCLGCWLKWFAEHGYVALKRWPEEWL